MRKSINPSVLCISSICGLECIDGAPITYSVAKAALNAYIKFSSRHHATSGVRINGIVPGNLMIEGTSWDHKLTSNLNLLLNISVRMYLLIGLRSGGSG